MTASVPQIRVYEIRLFENSSHPATAYSWKQNFKASVNIAAHFPKSHSRGLFRENT